MFPLITLNGIKVQCKDCWTVQLQKEWSPWSSSCFHWLTSLPLQGSSNLSILSYVSTSGLIACSFFAKGTKMHPFHSYSQLFLRGRSGGGWWNGIARPSLCCGSFFLVYSVSPLHTYKGEVKPGQISCHHVLLGYGTTRVFSLFHRHTEVREKEMSHKGLWFILPFTCFLSL